MCRSQTGNLNTKKMCARLISMTEIDKYIVKEQLNETYYINLSNAILDINGVLILCVI